MHDVKCKIVMESVNLDFGHEKMVVEGVSESGRRDEGQEKRDRADRGYTRYVWTILSSG